MTVHRKPIIFGSMPTILVEDIVRAFAADSVGAATTQQASICALTNVHMVVTDLLFDLISVLDPDQLEPYEGRIRDMIESLRIGGVGIPQDELEPEPEPTFDQSEDDEDEDPEDEEPSYFGEDEARHAYMGE